MQYKKEKNNLMKEMKIKKFHNDWIKDAHLLE